MGEPELSPDAHEAAAEAFVERATACGAVRTLYPYGSTARGEAEGLGSDVDVLAVITDESDRTAVSKRLRDIAFDVMIEHGPVVHLHVLSESTFEQYREEGRPVVRAAVSEGRSYA